MRVSRFLNLFPLPIACVQTSPISFHPRKSVHLVRMVSFSHYSVIEVCYFLFLQLDITNKKIVHIEEGLHVFIKVQLGLFSAMIVLFAIVMYYASHSMWCTIICRARKKIPSATIYGDAYFLRFSKEWIVRFCKDSAEANNRCQRFRKKKQAISPETTFFLAQPVK